MKAFVLTVMFSVMSVLVSIAVTAAASGYTPKYRVKVQANKHIDFSKLRTYSWMEGQPATIAAVDVEIVAAIERELSRLGMSQVRSGSEDIVVTYASVMRTDINTKSRPIPTSKDYRPEYSVGTLVVSLLEPVTLRPLLQLRTDKPLDRAAFDATVVDTIEEMFTYFPTRRK